MNRTTRAERWAAEAARLRRWLDSFEQMCDNGHDSGLSIDRAIMRGGPGGELSPPAGSASPHEAKS